MTHEKNEDYLDMVESYFEQVSEKFYRGEGLEDMRQELSYQTGVTPESIERARNHEATIRAIPDEHKPLTGYPP